MYEIPILLIVFNRPDTTIEVFNCIKKMKPKKLYIALDGPRDYKIGEERLCNEVRLITEDVDWNCQVFYNFNSTNKGAEVTVSNAISWVLGLEKYVVVLEDDIVASESFFNFMELMLNKYINQDVISMVSGCNFTPIKMEDDYLFGIFGHTWGWGTWRRAWNDFDLNIDIKDEYVSKSFLIDISFSHAQLKYYERLFKSMKKRGKGKNTWDYCWSFHRIVNNKLSIIPRVNLTTNIGVYGLHAKGKNEHHFRPFDKDFVVVKEPLIIERNLVYDNHHFEKYLKPKPLYKLIYGKTKNWLNN
jgi:hypothetical protein